MINKKEGQKSWVTQGKLFKNKNSHEIKDAEGDREMGRLGNSAPVTSLKKAKYRGLESSNGLVIWTRG